MLDEIKNWLNDWKETRGMTIKFLEIVPKEKFNWKPHELLGTFGMQVRHLIIVQKNYIDGMKKKKIDFSDKSFDKKIESDKKIAISRLKKLDKELEGLLEKINNLNHEIVFVDGVSGEHKVKLLTVLTYLVNHEFYHQGIFTCYGRLAGLGKFTFM